MRKCFIGLMMAVVMMFGCVGCTTNGMNTMDQMSTTEQKAWARVLSRLVGQGVCAVKPDVAPPVRAVLDTVVSVNDVLSGDYSNTNDMKDWVAALKRSADLVKKKSFRNNVKDLLIIIQERGMLDANFDFIDMSKIDTGDVDIDEILSWIRNCAAALSEGLEDCTEG